MSGDIIRNEFSNPPFPYLDGLQWAPTIELPSIEVEKEHLLLGIDKKFVSRLRMGTSIHY